MDGLDVPRVIEYFQQTGVLRDFPEARPISNGELLTLAVDVLVPAALEGQITADNASDIQARLIVEGANGPTTPGADVILSERGILVVPDILANSGGLVVSYLEWVQDRYGHFWKEAEVDEALEYKMLQAVEAVWTSAQRLDVDLRTGAYCVALERIVEARQLRGLYA
jgi:glutamate dehydrogenase/leucine dehydrogenase